MGRYSDLDELSLDAGNNLCLLLAINSELREVHRSPPKEAVERALRLILHKQVKIKERDFEVLADITALIESAHIYHLRPKGILASVLQRYLPEKPPFGWASQFSNTRFLRYFAPIL